MDALLLAEVNNFLLWAKWVVLDLVNGRDDGGLGQKLLEVLLAVVGDTNSLDLAGRELLHALPGSDMGVRVVNVTRTIRKLGEERVVAYDC